MEYYDGTSWYDFVGKNLEVNDKILTGSSCPLCGSDINQEKIMCIVTERKQKIETTNKINIRKTVLKIYSSFCLSFLKKVDNAVGTPVNVIA